MKAKLPGMQFVSICVLLLGLVACGNGGSLEFEGMPHMNVEGHDREEAGMAHMHVATPEEFEGLANPAAGDSEAIAAGADIFAVNCASCHGPAGEGDGPAAEGLNPKPAALADGMMMNTLTDGYLFWRVSKGGQSEPFNSAMPAWENALTIEERWQVISFIRTLQQGIGGHDGNHMGGAHMESGH